VWSEWHGHGFFRDTSFQQLEVRLPGALVGSTASNRPIPRPLWCIDDAFDPCTVDAPDLFVVLKTSRGLRFDNWGMSVEAAAIGGEARGHMRPTFYRSRGLGAFRPNGPLITATTKSRPGTVTRQGEIS
jgi:hypothetical protein